MVDSSAWIEFFNGGPNAGEFREAILDVDRLVVPAVVLLEVERRLRQRGWVERDEILISAMRQGEIVPLDEQLARNAAALGVAYRLPLADSIVYAVARSRGGIVWTQDGDFESLPGVEFRPKR